MTEKDIRKMEAKKDALIEKIRRHFAMKVKRHYPGWQYEAVGNSTGSRYDEEMTAFFEEINKTQQQYIERVLESVDMDELMQIDEELDGHN